VNEGAVDAMCRTARVVVTCGTGGVGKTSVAAALGLHAARLGRRAVVVTIDPARRLADAIGMGGALGDEPARVGLEAPGEMWVCMLDVGGTFDRLVADTAPDADRAREVTENPFYRSLSRSLSGTRDYMAAERLYELSRDPRFDLVIVDTPPSRNALDFLESPERLARFLRHPLVRMMMASGRGGLRLASAAAAPVLRAVSTVVGTDALEGAMAFLRAFDGMQHEFTRRAGEVARLLRGDTTAFVVVTAPSPAALDDAGHFVAELSRLGVPLRLVVANRMPPDFGAVSPEAEERLATATTGAVGAVHGWLAGLARDAESAREGSANFLARTHDLFPLAARVEAEEFATDIHDMGSITVLADELAGRRTRQ
jgi:anion-transporting  ArsA/GET3 family ATPase